MSELRTIEEALSVRKTPWLYTGHAIYRGIDLVPPSAAAPPGDGPVVVVRCDDVAAALRAIVTVTRAGSIPVLWPSRAPLPEWLARIADSTNPIGQRLRAVVPGAGVGVATSGTTGRGSVVVLEQGRALANAKAIASRMYPALEEHGVAGLRSPAFSAGLVGDLLATLITASAAYAPPMVAAPELAARTIRRLPVRGLHCTTAVAIRTADVLPRDLRHVFLSGDVLRPGVVSALRARCPGVQVWAGYGLSEAGPRVSLGLAPPVPPLGWAGAPLPGVVVSARDGALWVRTQYAAVAVLDDHGVGELPAPGEELDTGDSGAVVGGNLLVLGRRAAGASFDGTIVYPAEIEHALSEAGILASVTVAGDYCVVTLHDTDAAPARVRAIVRAQFPFLPEIRVHRTGPAPLTKAGKVR